MYSIFSEVQPRVSVTRMRRDNLPRNVFGTAFKSIDLTGMESQRAGVDTKECLEDIAKHGFSHHRCRTSASPKCNLIDRCRTWGTSCNHRAPGTLNNPSLAITQTLPFLPELAFFSF